MTNPTKQQRKPLYRRQSTVRHRLQERDAQIIYHVYRHRFLSSEHIRALFPGSHKGILRRLHLLFHAGYLDRPPEQIRPYRQGSDPMVYGLGNKGADVLAEEFKIPRAKVDWTSKNRNVQTVFLYHALLVSNFMVCLELACREARNVKIIQPEEILIRAPRAIRKQPNPFSFRVQATRTVRGEPVKFTLGIVPDKVFGLHFPQNPPGRNRAYFFLEADRATMPIKRRNLFQTSVHRKMLAYWLASPLKQNVFQKTFGFKYARVLIVTKSQERINSMMNIAKQMDGRGKGSRMFLFSETANLKLDNPTKILDKVWQNERNSELVSLLD